MRQNVQPQLKQGAFPTGKEGEVIRGVRGEMKPRVATFRQQRGSSMHECCVLLAMLVLGIHAAVSGVQGKISNTFFAAGSTMVSFEVYLIGDDSRDYAQSEGGGSNSTHSDTTSTTTDGYGAAEGGGNGGSSASALQTSSHTRSAVGGPTYY